MLRIGQGMDFHKLETNPARPLVLGGFLLDSDYALVGHSDADIVLHALSDAILGAVALGDIGDHFPDSDPDLKNIDSRIILKKSLELAANEGFFPQNTDITIMAERPKISPVRNSIRQSIADLLKIPLNRVSVKATTTEKMGFVGREEGMAVSAVILLVEKTHI